MKPKVVIIGAGQIGRALGQAVSKNARVFYWDVKPSKTTRHQPLSELLPTADIVLYCVPSWRLRQALLESTPHLSARAVTVFISKGLEASTGYSADGMARALLSPRGNIGFIGGPLLSGELRKGKTGIGVIASKSPQVRKQILALFDGTNLALESSSDLTGVIMSGVLKNIYTLGLGMIDGLGLGLNAKGWYVAQASAEAARLVVKFGGRPGTFLTTAGLGDFVATGFSPGSHGRRAGEELIRYGVCRTECEGSRSLPVLKKKLGHGIDQYPLLLALTRSMTGLRRARQTFTKLFQSINDASVAASSIKPQSENYRSVTRNSAEHRSLALKAASQAERVLPFFEKERPDDERPRQAIEAIRAWAQGKLELGMAEVRRLSLGSHAAARAAKTDAARFAARAAGQAVATWHVPNHALAVPEYVRKAIFANKK